MTKQHVIVLADWIRDYNENAFGQHKPPFEQDHIQALAEFCAWQNSRFKHQRWIGYVAGTCGPNGTRRTINDQDHCTDPITPKA